LGQGVQESFQESGEAGPQPLQVHRSRFYEHKRRLQTQGREGLKDLPPVPKSQLLTTPAEVVEMKSILK